MARSWVATTASAIRSAVAIIVPTRITRALSTAGNPAAAMPTATALSPASTTSMTMTDASAPSVAASNQSGNLTSRCTAGLSARSACQEDGRALDSADDGENCSGAADAGCQGGGHVVRAAAGDVSHRASGADRSGARGGGRPRLGRDLSARAYRDGARPSDHRAVRALCRPAWRAAISAARR